MVVPAFYSLTAATEFEDGGGENGREGFFTESSFHKNISFKVFVPKLNKNKKICTFRIVKNKHGIRHVRYVSLAL